MFGYIYQQKLIDINDNDLEVNEFNLYFLMDQKYGLNANDDQIDFEKEKQFMASICTIYQLFYLIDTISRLPRIFQNREFILESLFKCPEFVLNKAYASTLFEAMIEFVSWADAESIREEQYQEMEQIFLQKRVS